MEFRNYDILKKHEGLRLEAYDDLQPNKKITSPEQIKGTLTIGYGTIKNVYIGQVIDEKQAEEFLRQDVKKAEKTVNDLFRDFILTQNEYDALVIFIYNIGNKIYGTNTLSAIQSYLHAKEDVSFWWKKWVNAKGEKLSGLVNRRDDEIELFFN